MLFESAAVFARLIWRYGAGDGYLLPCFVEIYRPRLSLFTPLEIMQED